MKVVKLISVYALLLLMLFSSLGISFYLHDCHCRHEVLVSVGVGFTEPEPESCCSSCGSKPALENHGLSISRKGCCNDYVYFYILPVTQDNVIPKVIHQLVANVFKTIATNVDKTEFSSFPREIIPALHPPPLMLPGRKIIYLFQQIKIPNPAC